MFNLFQNEFPMFEYNRQFQYHQNAETAFLKVSDDSFVKVSYSDETKIANSTWSAKKQHAFLFNDRIIGPYTWKTLKSSVYNTLNYKDSSWFRGFSLENQELVKRLKFAQD